MFSITLPMRPVKHFRSSIVHPANAVLQMCRDKNCTCLQHQILEYLEKGLNEEAKVALAKLENFWKLTDDSGLTLLHYSVKHGNAEMTQHLIDQGCKVDSRDNSGDTSLMLAIMAKDVMTVKILLKNNADIYVTNCSGSNSLEIAFYTRLYSTALVPLSQNSHLILEILFDKVNNDFLKGNPKRVTHFLLRANHFVKLPFVVFGNAEMVDFLLRSCYLIDYRESRWGLTALQCAVIYARLENTNILIERGANVSTLDRSGRSLLNYYIFNFEDVDENSDLLKTLLKHSNILSMCNESNYMIMDKLLLSGKKKTIRTVLLSGLNLDDYFGHGSFLLDLLTANKNAEANILDIFDELHIKFDVNQRCPNGRTALMAATFYGCPQKVEFLLRHGADTNLKNVSGYSALTFADVRNQEKESNVAQVIEMLLQHGADARSFFSDRPYRRGHFSLGTKVIVAHWAMLEALEQSSSSDFDNAHSGPRLRRYYDSCKRQLEEMKKFKVQGIMTLFQLLREGEKTIMKYARNRELLLVVSNTVNNLSHFESYYVNILQRNVFKGLDLVGLQEKSVSVIEALTGLCSVTYYAIVYKIIAYLDRQDLCNLSRVKVD